ncbi:LysR substrate-binding domain-containing protein, partial [Mesorhizobium sp. P5_C1]
VACAPVFSAAFIAAAVGDFQKNHDEVTITVDTQLSPAISEVMSAQRFDIGLAASAVSPHGVKMLSFAECNEVCILPAGHRLAGQGLVTLQDLEKERWISFAGNDPARYRLDGLFESVGIRRKITAEAHHSATVCEMVMRGVGIAVVNPFTAVEFLDKGLLMRRFGAPLPFNTFLLRASYRPESPLVDSFVASLFSTRDAFL